jgi:hypothetical protein
MEAYYGAVKTHHEPWRLAMKAHPGARVSPSSRGSSTWSCVEARPGVEEVYSGIKEEHPEALEAHPEAVETHSRAMEALPEATETHTGTMEAHSRRWSSPSNFYSDFHVIFKQSRRQNYFSVVLQK